MYLILEMPEPVRQAGTLAKLIGSEPELVWISVIPNPSIGGAAWDLFLPLSRWLLFLTIIHDFLARTMFSTSKENSGYL